MIAAVVALAPFATFAQSSLHQTRASFEAASAKVAKGMTMDEVEALIGKPDEVHSTAPHASWHYGTNGKGTLATLYTVNFKDGEVMYWSVSPHTPPSTDIISEVDLRQGMREMARYEPGTYTQEVDPLRLIQATNYLIDQGEPKARAILSEYAHHAWEMKSWLEWITATAFQWKDTGKPAVMSDFDSGFFPESEPWDSFPILELDGVPILFFRPHGMAGLRARTESYSAWFKRNADRMELRTDRLVPPHDPLALYTKLRESEQWPQVEQAFGKTNVKRDYKGGFILGQLLRLVRTSYPLEPDDYYRGFDGRDFEAHYKKFLATRSHWDASRQMYLRKDGTPPQFPRFRVVRR